MTNKVKLDPWTVYVDYQKSIEKICRYAARHCPNRYDELLSEAAIRLPGICRNYDGRKGASVYTHMAVCLRWYLFKYLTKGSKLTYEVAYLDDIPDQRDWSSGLDKSEVYNVIEQLEPVDYMLLYMRYIDGLNFAEMGELLGRGRTTVYLYFKESLKRAAEVVDATT